MKRGDQPFAPGLTIDWKNTIIEEPPAEHECEIDREGRVCGKPARYQSLFALNLKATRFAWVCDEHQAELLECARSVPLD